MPAVPGKRAGGTTGLLRVERLLLRTDGTPEFFGEYGSLSCPEMLSAAILMHMRTTIILDEPLLEKAQRLTGVEEKTALIHAGLQALIARESARRLAALGKSEPQVMAPRRRQQPPRRAPR
jgi:Arc/MetJ family transcription regulator